MATIHQQIINGTLVDDASVAELLRRQTSFLTDTELPAELRSRGLGLFNTALFTDTPATSQASRSVVTVLRHTIEAIEALYIEPERQQAAVREADKSQSSAMTGVEEEAVPEEQKTGTTPKSTKQVRGLESSQSPRVQAALEARRKRRGLTHAPCMSAIAGVLKALNRPSGTTTPGSAKRINVINEEIATSGRTTDMSSTVKALIGDVCSSLSPHANKAQPTLTNRTTRSKGTGSKLDFTPAKPSLIVKLRIPSASLLTTTTTTMKQKKPVRRSNRKKVKSEEFVTAEIEENVATTTNNHEEDIEMIDAPDTETKRTTRSSTRTRTQTPKSLASSTPSTYKSLTNTSWETTSSISVTSFPSTHTTLETHKEQERSDKNSRTPPSTGPTTSSLSPPSITPPKSNNRTSALSLPPTLPNTYTFPPIPKLPAPRRAPFRLGASIALSNIREDHVLYPTESLLEIIRGLEDDLPTFERDDWEHRTVVKGGMWVCGIVRGRAGLSGKGEGDGGGEVGNVDEVDGKVGDMATKGKGKRKRVEKSNVEVDVDEIVKTLEEWVEKEWERIKPAEKVVVLIERDGDESEDDCGCGSRHRTPEVEDFERRKRKS